MYMYGADYVISALRMRITLFAVLSQFPAMGLFVFTQHTTAGPSELPSGDLVSDSFFGLSLWRRLNTLSIFRPTISTVYPPTPVEVSGVY